jgi:hypothetical protein
MKIDFAKPYKIKNYTSVAKMSDFGIYTYTFDVTFTQEEKEETLSFLGTSDTLEEATNQVEMAIAAMVYPQTTPRRLTGHRSWSSPKDTL